MSWLDILTTAVNKNGLRQFFFYLNNLDASRFIELTKAIEFLENRNGIVLELGSGDSVLPEMLSSLSSEYIALDLSMNASKYQKSNSKNIGPIVADMRYLPFKSSLIPNIIAISSIEHVAEDLLVFEEISRVLKEDGIAIISVPFTDKAVKIEGIKHSRLCMTLLHRFTRFWRVVLGKKHFEYFIEQTATDSIMKHYNEEAIQRIVDRNNLGIEAIYIYGKGLQQRLWRLIPRGWFVLKDFVIGWMCWKIEERLFKDSRDGKGVVMKVRKEVAG
jgi:SAM-dependent methyltransferase